MLHANMPYPDDPEGPCVPDGLPPIIDAHVHVFPEALFAAVHKWFDAHAWRIRYRLSTREIFDFLLTHGIRHIIALQYAHKPGIARELNGYLAENLKTYRGRVTGLATVFPGEAEAESILGEAFVMGLGGLKLHAHVQCFAITSPAMYRLYECCAVHKKPVVMHVGNEPKSPAYGCDPHLLCKIENLAKVTRDFPELKICVPHLGFNELDGYRQLLDTCDNLWLDTAMLLAGYFPLEPPIDLRHYRADRIMYGSDFPNIPYAWDRELHKLSETNLPKDLLARVCWRNAVEFFEIGEFSEEHDTK
jgi:hypothetical protein